MRIFRRRRTPQIMAQMLILGAFYVTEVPRRAHAKGDTLGHALWMLYEVMEGRVRGAKAQQYLGYAAGIIRREQRMGFDAIARILEWQ